MKKNIIKTTFLGILLFFSIAFINIDAVKADCSCYYYAYYDNEYDISANEGGNAEKAVGTYNYFAEINFTQDGDSSLVRSCNNFYTESTLHTIEHVAEFIKGCSGQSLELSTTKTFKGTAATIANKGCSLSDCNRAKLFLEGKSTVTNKKTAISFAAKEKDEFEQKIEDETTKEGNISGVDDIDPGQVQNWGNKDAPQSVDQGSVSCDLIPSSIIKFLSNLFLIVQIIGVLLLVILSGIEFIKAITGSDEDGLKGAIKNTFRRIIMVVILLILPVIIIWVLNIINDNKYEKENGNYVIGENGNPVCK